MELYRARQESSIEHRKEVQPNPLMDLESWHGGHGGFENKKKRISKSKNEVKLFRS